MMNDRLKASVKNLGIRNNVSFRVIDQTTGKVVQEVSGHNSATNSMLTGIAHYLTGDGVLSQGVHMLSNYIPKYISLGTMGLYSQDSDESGLPLGIGVSADYSDTDNFNAYKSQTPGFGADGYDSTKQYNHDRSASGLGPMFNGTAVGCELISSTSIETYKKYNSIYDPDTLSTYPVSFPRSEITYRDIVPETNSELPRTIDVVYSAMVSTGALSKFRGNNDYIFVTEAGLWSKPTWSDGGDNGLLAGYRIFPNVNRDLDMSVDSDRELVRQSILRVGINQVVQVIWKVQLGAIDDLYSTSTSDNY
jgi:hypothetical protein